MITITHTINKDRSLAVRFFRDFNAYAMIFMCSITGVNYIVRKRIRWGS
jgi:hypothetical protein